MKRAVSILKSSMLGLCALVFLLLFCIYTIPGALLWLWRREQYPRWVGSALALSIAIISRLLSGRWNLTIGDPSSSEWWVEIMEGTVSWAIASILVAAGYAITAFFVKGRKKRRNALVSPIVSS